MPISWNEIKDRALEFSNEWKDESRENAEAKSFWDDFFNVFGLKRRRVAVFERHVKKLGDKDGFIDLFWPGTLLVEHKSRGKSLDAAIEQSTDYFDGLDGHEIPRYIIVTDFENMRLIDLECDTENIFKVQDLVDNVHLFNFIAGYQKRTYKESDPVNIEAAELMGKLHDKLKENGYSGHQLEVYLVRLLFCLFADDTGIFEKDSFQYFLMDRTAPDGSDLGSKLTELFQYFNVPEDERPSTLDESINAFPYINGKLFEEQLPVASFNREMRLTLVKSCFLDWGKVSPAIFGSLFQSVMDPELRRNLGAHYTSEKNILKLINALFMDELWAKFHKVKHNIKRLMQLYDEIAELKFFDPACGCGNFLIIAYKEIRLLEIEILKILSTRSHGDIQHMFHIQDFSKIDVDSFYGIELEEFPARIAEVAMWLIDHQMNMELSRALGTYYIRLPLKKSANIYNDNALKLDWHSILPPTDNVYVLGNPPFAGKQYQSKEQKEDLALVFKGVPGKGVLDYVTAWYMKAAEYIKNNSIKVAFVSTNSITQGEQVGILWNQLYNKYKIKIHFAHTTFKWSNEATGEAAVYVVIIGFANFDIKKKKLYMYDKPTSEAQEVEVNNINPYLVEGDDIVILKRRSALCDVPKISFGSMPNDGGNLILTDTEKEELLTNEPAAERFVKPLISAKQFLNGENRWCLWLVDADPSLLRAMPEVMRRVELVREKRSQSPREPTRRLADTPTLFGEIRQPQSDYILIPLTSSENRKYIPFSYLDPNSIVNNSCSTIADATMYHFGVLMSSIHMLWVNYVCGRLKGDYRYSNEIVYNNFPWPEPDKKQQGLIEEKAQKILDVRSKYPDSTLADLYDPLSMPPDLVNAHKELDKAVDKTYGKKFYTDSERMKLLFELYENYIQS